MRERSPSPARPPRSTWERITHWLSPVSRAAVSDDICPSRWHELRAEVEAYRPLRIDHVDLPGTDVTLRITRPYPVITPKRRFGPYWGEAWPSGIVLAGVIAQDPAQLQGKRVLELGPGVGVTAVAALQAGADLIVADAVPGSLTFTTFNGIDQAGIEPKTIRVNWRKPSSELFAVAGDGFSVVLAADALYEDADIQPLLSLVERIVAPGGELWLAEPGRDPAVDLVRAIRKRGWRGKSVEFDTPRPDPHYHNDEDFDTITVHRLRRPNVQS